MKRYRQNLHTHTRYCDGKDGVEEMIRMAIEKGFTTLGFSGHGTCYNDSYSMRRDVMECYVEDVLRKKQKYQKEIEVYLGVEEDVDGENFQKGEPFDYIIGSVHMMKTEKGYLPIDKDENTLQEIIEESYGGDFLSFAKAYYEKVKEFSKRDDVDIIGHVDLLMKYNDQESFHPFEEEEYLKLAFDAIDVLIARNKIIEVNTGAMARGSRSLPYPHPTLLRYIREKKGRILINSDCHDGRMLDYGYEQAMELVKEAGFTTMSLLTRDGFEEVELSKFK